MRLLPEGDEYKRQVVYMESINGQHTEKQAIRLKELYEDFECDYVIMDCMGVGMGVFDACTKVLYDEERDKEYAPWTCFNDEKMAERAFNKEGLPVIYSIKVNSLQQNHEIATGLKIAFERRKIELLVGEIEGREYLADKKVYKEASAEERAKLIIPYAETTRLLNELINLEYEIASGYIRIKEVGKNRKDRYSSVGYANYLANILEKDLKSDNELDPDDDFIYFG